MIFFVVSILFTTTMWSLNTSLSMMMIKVWNALSKVFVSSFWIVFKRRKSIVTFLFLFNLCSKSSRISGLLLLRYPRIYFETRMWAAIQAILLYWKIHRQLIWNEFMNDHFRVFSIKINWKELVISSDKKNWTSFCKAELAG